MPNLTILIVGRCIQVGILSVTVPIYQCEIAPGHGRGLFVSIEYLCLNAGYALSTWVGYAFFYIPHEISWQGPYIIQACLSIALVIWRFFLPETPRWLIKNRFQCQGMLAFADLHARGDIYDLLVTNSYAGAVFKRVTSTRRHRASFSHSTPAALSSASLVSCSPSSTESTRFCISSQKPHTRGIHPFALASVRWRSCVGLLRGHDSNDTFRRYLESEEAVVDWERGVGFRLGARWRAAVSRRPITHGPCKDTDCRWDIC